jgi:spore maturation protein CgeB
VRVVLFCHSLESCWNHGNAHFLRGVARELLARGHEVRAFEPAAGWSRENLVRDHGEAGLLGWRRAYPRLSSEAYAGPAPDLGEALDGADLVLVHEWNEPGLVAAVGRARAAGGRFTLLFHDTHHRMVSDPDAMRRFDLDGYDGVLAFGAVLRERYLAAGWARRAWVWHEAADTALFRPFRERTRARPRLGRQLGRRRAHRRAARVPARARPRLGLAAAVHGVRYPDHALAELAAAGIAYRGWLPNHEAPEAFARARVTVHVPRRPYVLALARHPHDPRLRGARLRDPARLRPLGGRGGAVPAGRLPGRAGRRGDGAVPARRARRPRPAAGLVETGLAAIRARHTCAHRVDELLAVDAEVRNRPAEGLARCA